MTHTLQVQQRQLVAAIATVALTMAFAGSTTVCAQPYRPRPIAAGDIAIFANRLRLSDEQRRAMDELYIAYLERFLSSRFGALVLDADAQASLAAMPNDVPDLGVINQWLAARDRNLSTMHALDDGFFSALESMLTETQRAMLPRVRLLRERTRLTQDDLVAEWYDVRQHRDLSVLVDALDLMPQHAENAAPIVEQYEAALTSLLRRLWDDAADLRRKWRQRLDHQDVDARSVWREGALELRPLAMDIVGHQRIWSERIADALPEQPAVILRNQFDWSRFYNGMLLYESPPVLLFFAQSLDDLPADVLGQLNALYMEAKGDRLRYHERLAKLTVQSAFSYRQVGAIHIDFYPGTQEEKSERLRPINEMIQSVQRAERAMDERMTALLGAERMTAVRAMAMKHTRVTVRIEVPFADREPSADRMQISSRQVAPPESFLPLPFSDAEADLLAGLLRLPPESLDQLRDAILAQREGFRSLQSKFGGPLMDLYVGSRARPIPGKPGRLRHRFSPPADIEAGTALMAQFMHDAQELDDQLYGHLLGIVPVEQRHIANAVWQCRTITARPTTREYCYEMGANEFVMALRCDAARVDPMSFLRGLELSDAERVGVLDVIIEEAPQLHEAVLELFRARLDAWTSWCRLYSVVIESEYQDQVAFAALREARPRHDETVRMARHEAIEAVCRLSDRIRDKLSPGNGDLYAERFKRAAFPVATYDPSSIAGRLDDILKHDNLTVDQRTRAALLRADFEDRYDRLNDRLAELDLLWEDAFARGDDGAGARSRLESDIDQIRFEREALNYVYAQKLAAIVDSQ